MLEECENIFFQKYICLSVDLIKSVSYREINNYTDLPYFFLFAWFLQQNS